MLEELLAQIKDFLRMTAQDDEMFDFAAQGMRKMYTALLKTGFNEAEALTIVAHQGLSFLANK